MGGIWTLEWLDKTGNQRTKSTYDLTLLHTINNSTSSHLSNIYFLLYSNKWLYLAQVKISHFFENPIFFSGFLEVE
jgi:hypothetical protein